MTFIHLVTGLEPCSSSRFCAVLSPAMLVLLPHRCFFHPYATLIPYSQAIFVLTVPHFPFPHPASVRGTETFDRGHVVGFVVLALSLEVGAALTEIGVVAVHRLSLSPSRSVLVLART